jgi:hypothetical protein
MAIDCDTSKLTHSARPRGNAKTRGYERRRLITWTQSTASLTDQWQGHVSDAVAAVADRLRHCGPGRRLRRAVLRPQRPRAARTRGVGPAPWLVTQDLANTERLAGDHRAGVQNVIMSPFERAKYDEEAARTGSRDQDRSVLLV